MVEIVEAWKPFDFNLFKISVEFFYTPKIVDSFPFISFFTIFYPMIFDSSKTRS